MTLVQATPPAPIISATDAKALAPGLAGMTDAQVNHAIAAATLWATQRTGRALGLTTYTYTPRLYDDVYCGFWDWRLAWAGGHIVIPVAPVQSVESIVYLDENGDEQTWDAANYRVEGLGNQSRFPRVYLRRTGSWPTIGDYANGLTINFTAGTEDTPADWLQAVLLYAQDQGALTASSSGSSGELKRVVIEGVGSREYHPSSSASASSGSKSAQAAENILTGKVIYG